MELAIAISSHVTSIEKLTALLHPIELTWCVVFAALSIVLVNCSVFKDWGSKIRHYSACFLFCTTNEHFTVSKPFGMDLCIFTKTSKKVGRLVVAGALVGRKRPAGR
jgi:hypothetical protein